MDNEVQVVEYLNDNQKNGIYQVDKALIDVQVATAHAYPRNLTKVVEKCKAVINLDKEIAESCVFTLPKKTNDNKKVTGPSVNLARIIAQNYGNIRVESRISETATRDVTAEAVCWDLESNVAVKVQVKRSIWGKEGRYSDSMIAMTSNAVIAIAFRNAVFNTVFRQVVKQLEISARKSIVGDISTKDKLSIRRLEIISGFKDIYGVTEEEILKYVGKSAIESIGEEDIVHLVGIGNAIKSGEASVDEVFRSQNKKFVQPANGDEAEKRLLMLISDSQSIDDLNKHKKFLKTNEQRTAWDEKYKELTSKK